MRARIGKVLGVGSVALLLAISGCTAPDTGDGSTSTETETQTSTDPGTVPDVPSEAVSIHILDVAGAQRVTQRSIDKFVAEHPDIIKEVTWESGGAPDLVGILKPQVASGDNQIQLVLTGNDGLSAAMAEDLWVDVVGEFGDRVSNQDNYLEGAAKQQLLSEGYGVLMTYTPSGPLLQYNPNEVAADQVPSTPDELLEWAEANPGKFGYARPANSGVGRTFLQALPYMLGDSDPKDPENGWDNTWEYLKELNQYVDFYTTGTGQLVSNMADGTWTMVPMTFGWDIEPRADGRAPNYLEVAQFDEYTFITDAHFTAIPKGLSADELSAVLNLLQFMLEPENNAAGWDTGYFYPGPSVEDATLDKAAEETQDLIAEFGRDWYQDAIDSHEAEP
ncbi:MAG: ABC transporter substrate-binding protein [Brooklawnia sp.]|jgi:putative spermidine/putrescine transport system substrate-binding protein